jgi:hypothetical protein
MFEMVLGGWLSSVLCQKGAVRACSLHGGSATLANKLQRVCMSKFCNYSLTRFTVACLCSFAGSHAAQMLARSGVAKLRLIDFDQVSLSSLNRHAVATRADVGLPKALVLKRRLLEVAPFVDIDARVALFDDAAAPELLSGTNLRLCCAACCQRNLYFNFPLHFVIRGNAICGGLNCLFGS